MGSTNEGPKSVNDQREQMIDAILGPGEDLTNESAQEILRLYEITDNDLIESFKASMSRKLKELPIESDASKQIAGVLRNVQSFQKELTGENLSPKERISRLIGGALTPPLSASYAFRGRDEDEELPDSDVDILEGFKKELADRRNRGES
ncbi:MAG: hypothetical protein ABIR33_05450 [Pyrinomonadaceae bacterium]